MIRFMSDTRYAGLEKEMQHIPGFRPRRSGMVISHLSGCLENQRSPCERRVTDCVPFYELLEVLAEEVAVSTFVSRVCRLTGRRNPCFFQNGHRVLSGKLNDAPSGRLFRADLEFLQRCPSL